MKHLKFERFIRFFGVGLVCTILNYFLLYYFTDILRIYYLLSFVVVFFIGNLVGFFLNKKYTFKSKTNFWDEIWKYHSVMISSLIINLMAIHILVQYFNVWYIHASLITTVSGIFYNFVLHLIIGFYSR